MGGALVMPTMGSGVGLVPAWGGPGGADWGC